MNDLNEMSNEEMSPAHTYHKGRNVKCDKQDRHALRDKLELCIDPLDPGHILLVDC